MHYVWLDVPDSLSCQRAEIIEWVSQGGGAVVDEQTEQNVHFTVECHGVVPSPADASKSTHVSSHWIRSCLEVPWPINEWLFFLRLFVVVSSVYLEFLETDCGLLIRTLNTSVTVRNKQLFFFSLKGLT